MKQFGAVRDGGAADAIDGVQPRYVIEPESAEGLAGLLAWASSEHVSVVLRGHGTKLGWGRRGGRIDVVASTVRLNRVLAHAHGDLTATVEAGATVGDLNRELARHGQWLPLQTSFGEATVGGTMDGTLSLHDPATNRRLTQSAQVRDCKPVKVLRWRTRLVPLAPNRASPAPNKERFSPPLAEAQEGKEAEVR